jgi:anti-sigma factor RsiW
MAGAWRGARARLDAWRRWPLGLAGSMAAALAAFALGLQLGQPSLDDRLLDQVTTNHRRAELTDHALDLASLDGREVVPWLDRRLGFAPPVRNLAADGFELQGVRLDYLDQRRVGVLVYRSQRHGIDLFTWPVPDGSAGVSRLSRQSRGLSVVRWSDGRVNYCAVSDADPVELERLASLMQKRTSV